MTEEDLRKETVPEEAVHQKGNAKNRTEIIMGSK